MCRYQGVAAIIISWFIAPTAAALCSAIIFASCRSLALRREQAFSLSFWALPPVLFVTVWLDVFFILTKVGTSHSP